MELGLSSQRGDAMLFSPTELTQPSHDFPHVWTRGERGAAIVGRAAMDDARMIERVDALGDQALEQRGRADSLALGASSERPPRRLVDSK
jgi:hypothetical protein